MGFRHHWTELQYHFQCRSITPLSIPEADRRTSRGGGRAARGVSSWSWFRCLRFSVAAWCKEAPDGGSFDLFRVSVASRLPARISIVGLICAVGSVSLPSSDRAGIPLRSFRASHLAAAGWSLLPARACSVFFLFRLLEPNFTPARRPMNNRTEQNGALGD